MAEGVGEWLTVGREFLEEALVGNNGVYGLRWLVSSSNGTKRGWRSLMRGGGELVGARAGSVEELDADWGDGRCGRASVTEGGDGRATRRGDGEY